MAQPYHGADAGCQPSPPPFSLGRVSIGLINRDRFGRAALANVEVTAGAFRFAAYVLPCGSVTLPQILTDEALAAEVGKAVRTAALAELIERWQSREEAITRRIRAAGGAA